MSCNGNKSVRKKKNETKKDPRLYASLGPLICWSPVVFRLVNCRLRLWRCRQCWNTTLVGSNHQLCYQSCLLASSSSSAARLRGTVFLICSSSLVIESASSSAAAAARRHQQQLIGISSSSVSAAWSASASTVQPHDSCGFTDARNVRAYRNQTTTPDLEILVTLTRIGKSKGKTQFVNLLNDAQPMFCLFDCHSKVIRGGSFQNKESVRPK